MFLSCPAGGRVRVRVRIKQHWTVWLPRLQVSRFFEASVRITLYGVSVPSLHRESTDSLIKSTVLYAVT